MSTTKPIPLPAWKVRGILAAGQESVQIRVPVGVEISPPCSRIETWGNGMFFPTSNSGKVGIFNPPHIIPPYATGDRLYLQEEFTCVAEGEWALKAGVAYSADNSIRWMGDARWMVYNSYKPDVWKWKQPEAMPESLSRATLEVLAVRCERVGEISEFDAASEGMEMADMWFFGHGDAVFQSPVEAFTSQWDANHGAGSFASSPWCWVYSVRKI